MVRKYILILLSLLLLSTYLYVVPNKTNELIIANIITMDPDMPEAEAMLIRGEKIVAIGTEADVMHFIDESTSIKRFTDQTVLPGFVAAHEHPTISAVFLGLVDLSALTHNTPEQAMRALTDAIADAEPGEWIYGIGLDPILMPEMILDRQQLDQLAPNNPVFLVSQFLHSFWVNSAALSEVGIDESNLPEEHAHFYERDDNGRLTGYLIEAAADDFTEALLSPLAMLEKLQQQFKIYRADGITTVASLGYNAPLWLLKWAGRESGQAIVRQVIYLSQTELDSLPDSPANGNHEFRVAGLKLWYDGSPYSGTMFLREPYESSELTRTIGLAQGHTGEALVTPEQFKAVFKQFNDNGWQVAIHSQGDIASEQVLSLMTEVGVNPAQRHRLEHGLLFPSAANELAVANNISISYHINHILYYGDALRSSFLGERSEQLLPLRSSIEQGMRVSLHADTPMFPANPFSLMQTAMNRQTTEGQTIQANQAISPIQALKSVTIDAAWQLHLDDKVGSLEVDKLADYIVVDKNPLTTETHRWDQINVLVTCVSGICR